MTHHLTNEILARVKDQGHFLCEGVSTAEIGKLLPELGEIMFVTDVTVKLNSKPLITSDRALDFHTDHPRADLIAWHCLRQTSQGGETILLDAHRLLGELPSWVVATLKGIHLYEHKVFDGDPERFPFLSEHGGRDKIYYSFWLVKDSLSQEQRDAITQFRRLTETSTPLRFRLKPGDVLVIDNGRMLHGRTKILGDKNRLLKRYWIETNRQRKDVV